MSWEIFEHIALVAIVLNTCLQFLDIIVYKTIILKEYRGKDKEEN
jgi:hypothetical protein